MPSLIDETPDATAWVKRSLSGVPNAESLGRLATAVLWTDNYLQGGEPIGGSDPSPIVDEINQRGLPLLHGHDPGRPAGRVVAAQAFASPSGTRFVAAILAYYEPESLLSFASFGIDPFPVAALPVRLGLPVGARIELAADPRDVPDDWLREVSEGAPLFVKQVRSSHNDAESLKELIHVALPYAALLWNPLVKSIGERAGKDIYAAVHQWLQKLWKKSKERRDPILDIQAHHNGCTVSFLIRGREVEQHYAAHAALPTAAAQAAKLIDTFAQLNANLGTLFYEFEQSRWVPSYGILFDGRIVSDRSVLIAYEQIPKSLSMGLLLQEEQDEKREGNR
ncbi:MAG TPA: hypothetical protein VN682_10215 [Terriglobales bacterium]|nr:hypothetical protein [Terriglobales bacterium]